MNYFSTALTNKNVKIFSLFCELKIIQVTVLGLFSGLFVGPISNVIILLHLGIVYFNLLTYVSFNGMKRQSIV